jgi:predicted nucleotide-binding protein (sugar kinase/HSP70/actin superfamily)
MGWHNLAIVSPSSENTYFGLTKSLRRKFWDAILIGDILRKMLYKIRPYEIRRGQTDDVFCKWRQRFIKEYSKNQNNLQKLLDEAVKDFADIKINNMPKPKVGIVGEIYVRNNPFLTDGLIEWIEQLGGEVLISSNAEWILYTIYISQIMGRNFIERLKAFFKRQYALKREEEFYHIAKPVLHDREEPEIEEIIGEGRKFVPVELRGEAILTIGRAMLFTKREKVDLIVNVSPTFCMPGTISSAILSKIEQEHNIPIVCNFYDGSSNQNKSLSTYLHFLREKKTTRHNS